MQSRPKEGQRFFLDSEPDLGLGIVVSINGRQFEIFFPGSDVIRAYSVDTAPVTRAYYRKGDRILIDSDDGSVSCEEVKDVHHEDGLYFYTTQQREVIPETKLSSRLGSASPVTRLINGQVDHSKLFELRAKTIMLQARYQSSGLQGLLGARAELLPHQVYVAKTALESKSVRVMLADEVGLGKTIEAGYIASHLLRCERASRLTFCVPSALLMQWFIELVRRFQITPVIWNEGCEDDAAIRLITYTDLAKQSWSEVDLLVVDEAHHLDVDSEPFVELTAAARQVQHLVLLSATPAQKGDESHIKRMGLLDLEQNTGGSLAANSAGSSLLIDKVESALKNQEFELLANKLELPFGEENSQRAVIDKALSLCAPSLKLKRNRRANVLGFPSRIVEAIEVSVDEAIEGEMDIPVASSSTSEMFENEAPFETRAHESALEAEPDTGESSSGFFDPTSRSGFALSHSASLFGLTARVGQAEKLIIKTNSTRRHSKWLIITHRKDDAIRTRALLESSAAIAGLGLQISLFHEDLNLIERDRAAAWFTDPEGAQILICSEIGSEGRNFQACSRLICLDLPESPDLLEQRIGRIDRIGQRAQMVSISLIFPNKDSADFAPEHANGTEWLLYRWYQCILKNLDSYNPLAGELHQRFWPILQEDEQAITVLTSDHAGAWVDNSDESSGSALLDEVRRELNNRQALLARENAALVDLNSLREPEASELVARIEAFANDTPQALIESLANEFNLHFEWIRENIYALTPSDDMMIDHIPGIPEDGTEITFSRETALGREDILFIGWDSPLVEGMFDLISVQDFGRASMMLFPAPKLPQGKMILESHFRLVIRHKSKHRMLAHLPNMLERIVFMQDFAGELSAKLPHLTSESLKTLPKARAREAAVLLRPVISVLETRANEEAKIRLKAVYNRVREAVGATFTKELERLQALETALIRALEQFELPASDAALTNVQLQREKLELERTDCLSLLENSDNGVISLELSSVRALLTTS